MKIGKSLDFLKPRLINILLTLFVLCLPILRDQYYTGEYVTWYRPIVVIFDYLQKPQQPQFLFMIPVFVLFVYFCVSLALVVILKFLFPLFRHWKTKKNLLH